MSFIFVRVFYKKCVFIIAGFVFFFEIFIGVEFILLVIVFGICIVNVVEVSVSFKFYCNGDGEWMVFVGVCICVIGYELVVKEF